jgi:hypothetical protein
MNVEISDVTRRFGRAEAVAGVSLETGPGVFGLLGPNGAGKAEYGNLTFLCLDARRSAPAATIRAAGAGRYHLARPGRRVPAVRPWPGTTSRPSCRLPGRPSRTEVSASRPVPLVAPARSARRILRHGRASAALAAPRAVTTRTT